jgi:O-antigen/teichoic acid export membrane protein
VLRVLALYVFVIGAALVPILFLGGIGKPKIPAVMHMCELFIHAALLYFLINHFGIIGAAWACLIRIAIDFLGMLIFSGYFLGLDRRGYTKILLPMLVAAVILLAFHFSMPPLTKALLFLGTLLLYLFAGWSVILEPRDKATVLRVLKKGRILPDHKA